MSREEMQAFEQRLQTDEAFAETFTMYKTIGNEMKEESNDELTETLSSLNKKYFTEKQEGKIVEMKTSGKKWWLYAAAASVFVAVLFIIQPWKSKTVSNEEVFAQNAVVEDLPTVVRGTNNDSLQIKASELYNKKDYATALPLLDSLTKLKPGEAQLQLSLGICYLQTGNYSLAINKFDSLAAGESIYKYDAFAWKALAFLKQDKREDCIAALKQIPAQAANFEKAKKMIKQLSK